MGVLNSSGSSAADRRRRVRRAVGGLAAVLAVVATVPAGDLTASVARPATPTPVHGSKADPDKFLFFASDGLRQETVERYAKQGVVPGFRDLLRNGAKASDNGLLTQAPPNTGAGWYTLATGAWPAVHGSTNNTFHINGQPFANRTAAFDPGVLQAETLAQAAERGGKKVAQIEWAGGRNGAIDGPTVDFRTFLSGRGVATNYISPTDRRRFIAAFGLQFDHPAGFAGQPPFPRRRPPTPRMDQRAPVVQPAQGDAPARARLSASTSTASTPTSTTARNDGARRLRPRAVLPDEGRRRRRRRPARRASGPTSRSRSSGGTARRQDRRPSSSRSSG